MELPNPLSKENREFQGNLRRARAFARRFAIKADPFSSLLEILSGGADPMVFAYLWLAVEENYNILLFAQGKTDRHIDAISALVPWHKTTLDIPSGNAGYDRRTNFLNTQETSVALQLKGAERLVVDRIIAKNMDKKYLDLLMSLPKYGTSHIASLKADLYNKRITHALRSKPFEIKRNNIAWLDISIVLAGDEGASKIAAITEYKWLERAEIKLLGSEPGAKPFENMRMLNGNKLNLDEIYKSKIIRSYARSNLVNSDQAVEELTRRAHFLETCAIPASAKEDRRIEMYYEIK